MSEQNKLPPEAVSGPKALFWFLTLFFSLDIAAISLGGLWFQFVNKWYKIDISYGIVAGSFSQESIKMEIASIMIAAPVFFFVSWLVRRAFKNGSLAPDNRVRMWITYIILFLVVALAIGDLIRSLFAVLNGDFTMRFLLKALTILLIAGYIFVYYWFELKAKDALSASKMPKLMSLAAAIVILASVVPAFFLVEAPKLSRQKAFDRTRVENLSGIKYAVDSYYYEYKKLPSSLEELQVNRGYLEIVDKETGKQYEYRATGNDAFELCADFTISSKDLSDENYRYPPYSEFLHDAGHVCFNRVVSAQPDAMKLAP